MNNYDLPESLQYIAEVIGREEAMRLVGRVVDFNRQDGRGRCGYLYIPTALRADSAILQYVSRDTAQRLVDAYGGEVLRVPFPSLVHRRHRDRAIRAMWAAGWRIEVIAWSFAVTSRTVYNVLGPLQ